jgi:hypothetical protein
VDVVEKSFAAATETSKLLITLSTAVVAFCATVVNVKDAEKTPFTPVTIGQRWLLAASWVALLVSTGIGVWTQLGITQVISEGTTTSPPSVRNRRVTVPFQLQIITFLVGIVAVVGYGISRLFN